MRLGLAIREISGKGSQMFMITALETTVYLRGFARISIERLDYLLDGELIQQKVSAKIKLRKPIYGHIFFKCKRNV